MDDYKQFFYAMLPSTSVPFKRTFQHSFPAAAKLSVGSFNERKALRQKLNCRSFKWYLENVHPEAPIPSNFYSIGAVRQNSFPTLPRNSSNAQIHTIDYAMCLDTMSRKVSEALAIDLCHNQGGNQAWTLTDTEELRSAQGCVTATGSSAIVTNCGVTKWRYDMHSKQLRIADSQSCLTAPDERGDVRVEPCNADDAKQKWIIDGYNGKLRA